MINLTTDIQQITAALTYRINGINRELNKLAENPIEGGDFPVSALEQSRSQAEELLEHLMVLIINLKRYRLKIISQKQMRNNSVQ